MFRLRLRELRQRHLPGATLQDLAERIGLSREHYNQMELGKVPVSTRWIGVFAELYGVPEHEVLGYHHPPEDEMDDERVELLALIQKLPQREVRTLVTLARELARQRDEGAGEQ